MLLIFINSVTIMYNNVFKPVSVTPLPKFNETDIFHKFDYKQTQLVQTHKIPEHCSITKVPEMRLYYISPIKNRTGKCAILQKMDYFKSVQK